MDDGLGQDVTGDTASFTTPPGGVMTNEVGAITGQVEVWTHGGDAKIRYAGADEVYTVAGDLQSRSTAEVAEALQYNPGLGSDGNAEAVDLNTRR